MQSATDVAQASAGRLWIGRIMSGIAVLFLLFDSIIHILVITPVVESFAQLGVPVNLAVPVGVFELCCLVLYLVPRTSTLGAVLLTGYLGGAVATQMRIGAPLFSTLLFPVYVGILLWGGLYLRDERLHAFFLLRTED